MELRHLRYFVAVVECHGYRKASVHLHVAQPALTQTVQDLEQELGSRLLLRESRGLTLTPAGKEFYDGAKKTLEAAEQAIVSARHAAAGTVGSLTLGFIPGAVQHFLPNLISIFKEKHPQIELHLRELSPEAQVQALKHGDLDLAFSRQPTKEQQGMFSSRWLFDVPLMVVVPSDRHVDGGTVSVASLRNERFSLIGRDQSPVLFDSIIGLCQDAGFYPKVDSYADLSESMYTLVQAGEGVSVAPLWTRVFLPRDLHSFCIDPDTVRVELAAVWRTHSTSTPLKAFLSLLDAHAEDIKLQSEREFRS